MLMVITGGLCVLLLDFRRPTRRGSDIVVA